jgi:hypothetical protein
MLHRYQGMPRLCPHRHDDGSVSDFNEKVVDNDCLVCVVDGSVADFNFESADDNGGINFAFSKAAVADVLVCCDDDEVGCDYGVVG